MENKLVKHYAVDIKEIRTDGRRCAFYNTLGIVHSGLCVEGEYGYIPLPTYTDEEVKEANEALGLSENDINVIVFSTFIDPDRASKDPELREFTYIDETKKAFELNLSEEELRIILVSLKNVRLNANGKKVADKLESLIEEVSEVLQNNYLLGERVA